MQTQRPAYREESLDLRSDGRHFRAIAHVVSAPDSSERESVYAAVANGFYEDPQTWRPLAQRLAKIALRSEQQLTLVTYEDSAPVGIQDILAFRADRLAQVIRATRTDGALVMGAHSRGWLSTVTNAETQVDELDHLVGFGVAGLAPRDLSELDSKRINELSSAQLRLEIATHIGLVDAWDKLVVGQRFLQNSLSYLSQHRGEMYREGSQVLSADVIARTVQLSTQVPTTIWVHGQDGYFDAATVRGNLVDAGYRGDIRDVSTSHLGPILEFSLVSDLYHDLVGSVSEN